MVNTELLMLLFLVICAVFLILRIFKHRRPLLMLLLNTISGTITLFLLYIFGGKINLYPNLNLFSLLLSAIFGIPGAFFASLLPLVQNL